MKWARAIHHLESLAGSCAEMTALSTSIIPLRVAQLWAVDQVLGPPRDLDSITVALCVDLPVRDVAWWSQPRGSEQWAHATRMVKNPILAWWRSMHAPVWNHRIHRPALIWDAGEGLRAEALEAVREGRGEAVRTPAPAADDLRARLREELAVSRDSLRRRTTAYEDRRWSPGKLEPVADALWRAADGYLDVLSALTVEETGG